MRRSDGRLKTDTFITSQRLPPTANAAMSVSPSRCCHHHTCVQLLHNLWIQKKNWPSCLRSPMLSGAERVRRPIASTFFRRAASSCLSGCALACTTARRAIQCFDTTLSGGKRERDPRQVTTELAELKSSSRGSVEDLLSEAGICTPRSGSSPENCLPPLHAGKSLSVRNSSKKSLHTLLSTSECK